MITFEHSGRRWSIGNASAADAAYIAERLRPADMLEVYASGGMSPLVAALESFWGSLCCFSVRCGDMPVAVFGVCRGTLLADEYVVWMLASSEVEHTGTAFARYSPRAVAALAEHYPVMRNYVGAWNIKTLRWLRMCGFEILPARRIGVHGEYLHPVFYRKKEG